jgi:cytochrome b561/polyisoprenoid-binding protein YceI
VSDGQSVKRYAGVAIAFHWAIAILILANFPIAWTMGDPNTDKSTAFALFQLHKSIGLLVLVLSVGRLLWRVQNPPPALPANMQSWERILSQIVHVLFYVVMVGAPLLGWMMVSASPTGIPTLFFGLFHWPHIAPLADAALSAKKDLHETLKQAHEIAAWMILGLLALHIGGALKHQFIDKEHYLVRMLPGIFGHSDGPARRSRGAFFTFGALAAILALNAGLGAAATKAKPPATAATTAVQLGPDDWAIGSANSKIAFAGKHEKRAFTGEFQRWTAHITFNPAKLQSAKAAVTIDLASAKTSSSYYDGTLPEADWFDIAKTPQASFTSKTFRSLGGDQYEADGDLTLRGITKTVTLPFTLKIDGPNAVMDGKLSVNRLDFKLGANADPKAEWVDDRVDLEIHVVARKGG